MGKVEKLELAMALLDEAMGFASLSPRGKQNINEVYNMLPELVEDAFLIGSKKSFEGVTPDQYSYASARLIRALDGVLGIDVSEKDAERITDFVLTETFGRACTWNRRGGGAD